MRMNNPRPLVRPHAAKRSVRKAGSSMRFRINELNTSIVRSSLFMSKRYVIAADTSTFGVSSPIPVASPVPGSPAPSMPQQQKQEIIFPWANPELNNPQTTMSTKDGFPPYFRVTTSYFPAKKVLAEKIKIPLGIVISPGLVSNVPVIDFSEGIPFRCNHCSAYLCPSSNIQPDGKSWICHSCGKIAEIKNNQMGLLPLDQRPELFNCVYDMIAPKSYVHLPQSGPAFLFLCDTSSVAYGTGFTIQYLNSVKNSIQYLNDDTYVGFITTSNILTVFDLINLNEIIVPDIKDMKFQVDPSLTFPLLRDCRGNLLKVIDVLLERTPDTTIQSHCYGNALMLAESVMKNVGGIILAGIIGMPKYGYTLNDRSKDAAANGESILLRLPPDGSGKIYRELALILNRAEISVHLFSIEYGYSDISTIGIPSGLTCGKVWLYPDFNENSQAKFSSDLFSVLTANYYYDSSLRLRTVEGLSYKTPYSNCVVRKEGLVSFPVFSQNTTVCYDINVEKDINSPTITFQLGVVHTNTQRIRMIRVFTFSIPSTTSISDILQNVDEGAIVTLESRRTLSAVLAVGSNEALQRIKPKFVNTLLSGANIRSCHHLFHGILSSHLFKTPHPLGIDGRMASIIHLRSASVTDVLLTNYPRMFVTDTPQISVLPLNSQSFGAGNVFLFHTVNQIFIWISANVSPQYLVNAFGVNSLQEVQQDLPQLNTPENQALQGLINESMNMSARYLRVEIITQGSPRESEFQDILVEDSQTSGKTFSGFLSEFSFR